MQREAERRLAAATAQIGVATAELDPIIHLIGFCGGAASEVPQLTTNETEQEAQIIYGAALEHRRAPTEAQERIHRS